VISEYIPTFPSFALSYTVRGGSRMETADNNGIYHLIEHMMFKGSKKYSLKEIANLSDRLGGKLNAFTSKEVTQLYIKAVDEHLQVSFDLLTEMVLRSAFCGEEFNKEKGVAIEEIHEAKDNPDTFAFESFYQEVFQNNGLGFPVGGQVEPVTAFQRDSVYDFYKQNYAPDNLVLATVGKVEHEQLIQLAQQAFKDFPRRKTRNFSVETPTFRPLSFSKHNPSLNQVYMILGFNSISLVSPLRFRIMILNDILGAGMSSRLFQKVREEKGLAYTVNSFTDAYLDCGLQLIYSVVKPDKVDQCLDVIKEEVYIMKKEGISETELVRAKDSIKSSIILGLESNVSKMRFNINTELFLNGELEPETIIEDINRATVDDINTILNDYLDLEQMSLFLYGDIGKER
jgi:predicted Zn-dependent peptidase